MTTLERSVLEAIGAVDEDCVVATVVGVRGSAYRKLGARMIATRERWIAGGVSAGCLEDALVAKAWWWLGERAAVVVTFDASTESEDGGVGSGCGGSVDVLIERGDRAAAALATLARCDRAQVRGGIATVVGGASIGARACVEPGYVVADRALPPALRAAMVRAANRACEPGAVAVVVAIEGCDVLVEPVVPRPRLFVLGTHPDAVPVAAFARQLGWHVTVGATTVRASVRDRFAGIADTIVVGAAAIGKLIDRCDRAAVAIMSHDYAVDRAHLALALESRARYIGALGPRLRTARMLEELGRAGDLRLHGPAGLAIGADTPEAIAVAIVAEAHAVLAAVSTVTARQAAMSRACSLS